jgi:HEAT repeat protein
MLSELHDILTELARAAQTFGMYPDGHPARASTCARLGERLTGFLEGFGTLELKIRKDRLNVEGESTDPKNVLLSGLCGRLYEHQLFIIRIEPEVEAEELSELLNAISVAVGKTGKPLGDEPPEQLTRWPHLGLDPVPFSALSFSRGAAGGTSVEVTDASGGLGSVAGSGAGLAAEESLLAADGLQSEQQGVERLRRDVGEAEQSASGRLRDRISRLVLKLNPQTRHKLHQIFRSVLQSETKDGSGSIDITDVESAVGNDEGDGSAEAALRFLKKLEAQVTGKEGGTEIGTDDILRELVDQLDAPSPAAEGGTDDPESVPDQSNVGVLGVTRESPVAATRAIWVGPPEPRRTLKMSVEVDEFTPVAESSLEKLLAAGEFVGLLDLLEEAPPENRAAETMWDWLGHSSGVERLLESDPPDFESLDRLIVRTGLAVANPMIDALIESESRTTRLALIDRLVQTGPEVGQLIVPRLTDSRWYVRRNMLTVLGQISELPQEFTLAPFLEDTDPKVRRQAMELGLGGGIGRWQVITAALRDADTENIAFGLAEAVQGCPPDVVPQLIKLIFNDSNPLNIRLKAIRAAGVSGSPKALDALLRLTWGRKAFVLRGLAPKTSEMLEALTALAWSWPNDPKAARVLAAANKARDPQTRAVASASARPPAEPREAVE